MPQITFIRDRLPLLYLAVAVSLFFAPKSSLNAYEVGISEFMAKNDSGLTTSGGVFADWLEIHNQSGVAVDLAGWYLTDDPSDPRKWQFPSTAATSPLANNGYLIVFLDDPGDSVIGTELHASFKLSSGGEYLALIEPDGETVAFQYEPEYPDQSADVSYGIDPGSGQPAFFASPTPGSVNGAAIADQVVFSMKSSAFVNSFNLTLSVPSQSALIRYTTDGSLPTSNSTLYTGPIIISGTMQVRAQAFDAGLVDGPIATETFYHLDSSIASFASDLPLIVLDNLGAGEVPHTEDGPARQASGMMLFDTIDGVSRLTDSPKIASRAGIRRRGESTKRWSSSKPNLSFETWGEFDEVSQSIKPLGMPAESDWVLFAPWNHDRALMRNSFIHEISNEMGRYAVRTRFVEVFLNYDGGSLEDSDYYGVYVLMERIKQGEDRVDIIQIESTDNTAPEVSGGYMWRKDKVADDTITFSAGGQPTLEMLNPRGDEITSTQQQWLINYIDAAYAACNNGTYESFLDVQSFIDLHILAVFSQDADGFNFSAYYHKDRDGRLKMGPAWDFDRSMGCDNDDRPSDPFKWSLATDANFFFRAWFFNRLANNAPDFWVDWTDRWYEFRSTALSDGAINARVEAYRAELSSAALRNFDRWTTHIQPSEWDGKVNDFKSHILARVSWIDDQLVDVPTFSQVGGMVPSGYQLSMTGPEAIYYTTDGSDPRASGGSLAGSTYNGPLTITQNTKVKARCWDGDAFVSAPATWPWSAMNEALFIVEPATLAVTEIMYHPRPPETAAETAYSTSDFEYIEIKNVGSSATSLVGVEVLDGVQFDLSDSGQTSLGPGQYGLLVRNLDAFKVRYPNWGSMNILGVYNGRLSDGGEEIELGYDVPDMAALIRFDYEDDWYPSTDGEGFSLVLRDEASALSTWDQKGAWRHSSAKDGSPGQVDGALAYELGSIVVNEVLSHQDQDNPGDWIELYNTTGSAINIGGWFLSDSRGNLKKYAIPANTVIPAGGYLVFTEFHHFGSAFALSEHGDSVYLSAGNGTDLTEPAYRESIDFGGQVRDVTFGRYVRSDGVSEFPSMTSQTRGSVNSGPVIGPIVFREVMYHPALGGHEYVELVNTSGSAVTLYDTNHPENTWKVSGLDFSFPTGTVLAAGASLLLVSDEVDPVLFRSINSIPPSIEIFSVAGSLDNATERLSLLKPGNPEAGTGYVPMILVETLKYRDEAPWPIDTDGTGRSLQRISNSAFANDSVNWQSGPGFYGPSLYDLTVISGVGDGAYVPGNTVPVTADPPLSGYAFHRWIGNVEAVADVNSSTTTLTAPEFDSTITAEYAVAVPLIEEGAVWKYRDNGLNQGYSWIFLGYSDLVWSQGAAELGYGDGGEETTLSYGSDSSDKHITTYFRKLFSVNNAAGFSSLTLELQRDDGAVVYLNGTEVVRDNMPEGTITYETRASGTVGGESERQFYSFDIDASNLVEGSNIVAVEIHQRSPTSSDISFDLRLIGWMDPDPSVADGDADQMYDEWEVSYFGSTELAAAYGDLDKDGRSNLEEFIAGTAPNDPSSRLQLNTFNGSQLEWDPVSGRIYSVHWTERLDQPFTLIADDVDSGSFQVPVTSDASGFYKIEVRME